jgi:hypothetical protein
MTSHGQPAFVPGYSGVHESSDRAMVVTSGVTGRCEVISARDWGVLQQALVVSDRYEIAAKSTLTNADVAALLAQFVRAGVIVPLPRDNKCAVSRPSPIVCVVTAERPAALRRSLHQLAKSAESSGCAITVRVHDNSRSASAARANADLCRHWCGPLRLRYHGEETRRRLASYLVAAGIDRTIVDFALCGSAHPRIGANRNAALLAGAGHTLVMLDDDVVPRVWERRSRSRSIALSHQSRPRTFSFAATRDELFNEMTASSQSIWDAHMEVLARPVRAVIEAYGVSVVHPPTGSASPSWGELMTAPSGKIRVSMHGIIGDSGMGWLRDLLLLPEPRALVDDRATYEATCTTGELRATVPCTTLSPRGTAPTGGMGLDASSLLPPFVPSHRCEDVLFLDTLRRIDPQAVTASLAQAVEHWPVDDRRSCLGPIWRNTGIRAYNVLRAIVLASGDESLSSTPDARLRSLGRAFAEIGGADAGDLRDLIRRVWLHHVARWRDSLDRALSLSTSGPEWWVRDATRFRDKLLAEADAPGADLPRDLDPILDDQIDYWPTLLMNLAALYDAWPVIWRLASAWKDDDDV